MRLRIGSATLERLGAILVLAGLCMIRVWDPTPLQFVRTKSFDYYQVLRPSKNAERPVVIVDLDEASLRTHGQWPWPRTLVAELTDKLNAAGAAAIGFDIVFAEADRQSPRNFAASRPDLPEAVRAALADLPSNDAVFAQALGRGRTVLGIALASEAPVEGLKSLKVPPIARLGAAGAAAPNLIGRQSALINRPEHHAAASGAGIITHNQEFDGVVRRIPAVYNVGGTLHPALAVELIRIATGGGTLVVRSSPEGVESVVIAGEAVPTDLRGRLWVRASHHDPGRYVSAADVLSGKVGKDRIEGRIALLGTSAVGLLDLRATPLEAQLPGVEIHAQLIENILFKDHIVRPFYSDAVEFFATVLLTLFLIAVLPRFGALRTLLSGFAAVGIVAGGAWLAFALHGLLFDVTFPLAAALVVFLGLVFFNYMREEKQRRFVRTAFGQYVSPQFVSQLAEHPERLKLGGEMRELTILFMDVRGFSGISEQLSAQELTAYMSRLFTPLTGVILKEGGTLDKFIGDAIMAFWNAPMDEPRHAERACRAALGMQAAARELNAGLAGETTAAGAPIPTVRIGIGLNTGECCVGNLGAGQRFNYSAIGDPVNVASRLEGETKALGIDIMLGESTAAAVPHFALLELGGIRVRGREATTRIYALMGDEAVAKDPAFRRLAESGAAFHRAEAAGDRAAATSALGALRSAGRTDLAKLWSVFEARLDAPAEPVKEAAE